MNKLTMLSAMFGGLMIFTGCQNTVNTMENTDRAARVESVNTKYFTTDSFCRDRLRVLAVHKSDTPGGLLKFQMTIRSERYGFWSELWSGIMGDNPYHIAYKVDWFDGKGMQVNTASSVWIPDIFIPGEVKYIQSVAPNANCKDFMVSFKEM